MISNTFSIAIDFGTARTKAAFFNPSTQMVQIIRLGRNSDYIPSLFHLSVVDDERKILYGDDAEIAGKQKPEGLVISLKSQIDSGRMIRRGKFKFPAPNELVIDLFEGIRRKAQEARPELKKPPEHCRLTVPVSFAGSKRDAIKQAALAAGFTEVDLIEEPSAAAHDWLRTNKDTSKSRSSVIIFDVGGGTSDYALLRRSGDLFEPDDRVPSGGNINLGGNVLDEDIYEELFALDETTVSQYKQPAFLSEIRIVREALNGSSGNKLTLHPERGQSIVYDRCIFVEQSQAFANRIVDDFEQFLEKCECIGLDEDTPIALIGGGSRIYGLKSTLESRTKRIVLNWDLSDFAVVRGAVVVPKSKEVTYSSVEGKYRQAVEMAWMDREIDESELKNLKALSSENGITAEREREIELEIMGETKETKFHSSNQNKYKDVFSDVKLLLDEGRTIEALKHSEKAVIYTGGLDSWEAWIFSLESISSCDRINESASFIASQINDHLLGISAQIHAHSLCNPDFSDWSGFVRSAGKPGTELEFGRSFIVAYAKLTASNNAPNYNESIDTALNLYPGSRCFRILKRIQHTESDQFFQMPFALECNDALYSSRFCAFRLLQDARLKMNEYTGERQTVNLELLLGEVERKELRDRLSSQANGTFFYKLGEACFDISIHRLEHSLEDLEPLTRDRFCRKKIREIINEMQTNLSAAKKDHNSVSSTLSPVASTNRIDREGALLQDMIYNALLNWLAHGVGIERGLSEPLIRKMLDGGGGFKNTPLEFLLRVEFTVRKISTDKVECLIVLLYIKRGNPVRSSILLGENVGWQELPSSLRRQFIMNGNQDLHNLIYSV